MMNRRFFIGVLTVGAGYAATLAIVTAIETWLAGGNTFAAVRDLLPVRIVGGLFLGVTLGPIAARIPGSRRRQFFLWSVLIYFSTVGVIVEGWAFAPDLVPVVEVPWSLLSYVAVAGVVAGALSLTFASRTAETATVPTLPSGRRTLVGLVVGTITYAVLYFVFGALNYAFVTGPYYEQQISGLVNPPIGVVIAVFLVRGALLSISLIPLVRTVEEPRQRAWMSAVSVAVLAGFLPLLIQINELPPIVLVASSYEIALQVGPTAVIVAAIFGKGASHSLRTELRRMWRGSRTNTVQ